MTICLFSILNPQTEINRAKKLICMYVYNHRFHGINSDLLSLHPPQSCTWTILPLSFFSPTNQIPTLVVLPSFLIIPRR